MASMAKSVMGVTLGLQSVALMGRAAQTVPKNMGMGKKFQPMKQTKNMTKGFLGIAVGTALMVPTAEMVNKL
jgi:hypothetical protein